MNISPNIVYLQNTNVWERYPVFIQELIERHAPKTVCDIGAGANPLLSSEFILNKHIEYSVLDISKIELDKLSGEFKIVIQDIEAADFPLRECYDFVFSKMLAEHIHDGRVFHRNIFTLLKPGGIAVHYFPTLYALPFVLNKLIPENISSFLLDVFMPRERYKLGKFPAFYDWCYGPTTKMLNMLTSTGFEILEFRGVIGHKYFSRIPLISDIHKVYSSFLIRHPRPSLTSFAQIILHKPLRSN